MWRVPLPVGETTRFCRAPLMLLTQDSLKNDKVFYVHKYLFATSPRRFPSPDSPGIDNFSTDGVGMTSNLHAKTWGNSRELGSVVQGSMAEWH